MARVINHAKALDLRLSPTEMIRFLGKVEVNAFSGCWIWGGALDPDGYGQFRVRGKTYLQVCYQAETKIATALRQMGLLY